MPLRGENVGTAYVRILADGTGLDRSIRDQFDDADGEFADAGQRNSKAYRDAFAKENSKPVNQTKLRRSITDTLAKGDWLEKEFFNGQNWKQFRNGLDRNFGSAGRLAGEEFEKNLSEGMSFDQFAARIEDLRPALARAYSKIDKDREAAYREHNRRMVSQLKDFASEERAIQLDRDEEFELSARRNVENYERISAAIDRLQKGTGRKDDSRNALIEDLEKIRRVTVDVGGAEHEFTEHLREQIKQLRFMHPNLNRYRANIDKIADSTGRAFGKGSRNNFINFIGSMARGFVGLLGVFPRLIGKLSDFATGVKVAFDESFENTGSVFRATMAGVASALGTGVIGLAAFAAAAVGAVVFIGPLVALLSLLAGVVTALAASISFALLGAVGALVGALLPLGAGLAVAIVGFLGLSDAAKKALGIDLKPLTNSFKDLAKAAGSEMFDNVGKQAKRLAPVVRSLQPLFQAVGGAISRIGDYWIKALRSPGFAAFRDEMTRFLPGAVESLGRSFGNFLGGLGGLFRGLIPLTDRFLDWLEKITGEFAKWSNSAKGQRELKQFFEDAGDSAKTFGDFLHAALDVLTALFDPGRKSGDNMITDMTKGLENLATWLRENPDALSKWFDDSEELFQDIGDLIVRIGELVDALDNAGTRIAANKMVQLLALNFQAMGIIVETAATTIGGAVEGIRRFFDGLGRAAERLPTRFQAIRGITGLFRTVFTGLPGIVANVLSRIVSFAARLPGRIRGAIEGIPGFFRGVMNGLPGIASGIITRIVTFWRGLPARVRGAISGVPGIVRSILAGLPGIAAGIVTRVVTAFRGVVGRIGSQFSGIGTAIAGRFDALVTAAGHAADNVVQAFSGLAGRIIDAVGTIHLPTPTINMPNIPRIHIPGTAIGGVFNGVRGIGQIRRIAEAGPEAVVPLNRPLSQVDPAVRWLSAIAQGKNIPGMASGGAVGRSIDASGWVITSPNTDTEAVASAVFNRLAAAAY